MLIGLCGFKGSGKDTVAKYLVEKYDYEQMAFANKLKESVAALFDIDIDLIDDLKNYQVNGNVVIEGFRRMTFRNMLQRYGTESHRDVFGENFWVDQVLPDPVTYYRADEWHLTRRIVISDARFENEQQRIRDLDGYVVRVDRFPSDGDTHLSEARVEKVDYAINNTGSLTELGAQIDKMIRWIADEELSRLGV
jgi:hypothetical protein